VDKRGRGWEGEEGVQMWIRHCLLIKPEIKFILHF